MNIKIVSILMAGIGKDSQARDQAATGAVGLWDACILLMT